MSIAYRLHRLLPLPSPTKLRLYLNAHWFFSRLSHEESYRVLGGAEHPVRVGSFRFIERLLPKDAAVLDLGCGTGVITRRLADRAAVVVGVDHNERSLEIAVKDGLPGNVELVHGDALEFLKGTEQSFDVLVLSHILEHLDDPGPFLAQFSGLFRFFYIEVPDFDGSTHNLLRQSLALTEAYADEDHVSEFSRRELDALIEEAGLTILESERIHGVQRLWCISRDGNG